MVYRRTRRRRRFRRRPRRFRRRMFRSRRRTSRRYRRSRFGSYTVGIHSDHILINCSQLPPQTDSYGTLIGVQPNGFRTWSINPLPITLGPTGFGVPWQTWGQSLANRTIAPYSVNSGLPLVGRDFLTDLPIVMYGNYLSTAFQCQPLWDICDEYRLSFVTFTFTIPENVQTVSTTGDPVTVKNHHLYIEWCNLPLTHACTFEEWVQSTVSGTTVPTSQNTFETYGWNYLPAPIAIAEACSVQGYTSGRHRWHRKQLSYQTPVTIRFRPRHAKLDSASIGCLDGFGPADSKGNPSVFRVTESDVFSQQSKFVRSYVPTKTRNRNSPQISDHAVCWFGPCIRLVDADISATDATKSPDMTPYQAYGIRVTMTAKLKLRKMSASTPLFPDLP